MYCLIQNNSLRHRDIVGQVQTLTGMRCLPLSPLNPLTTTPNTLEQEKEAEGLGESSGAKGQHLFHRDSEVEPM